MINHVISIRNRNINVSDYRIIANNINTDTFSLDLDSEWFGLNVVVQFECETPILVRYAGGMVNFPSSLLADVSDYISLTVLGYDQEGNKRLVTAKCDMAFRVVDSGCVIQDDPYPEYPDLLHQLVTSGQAADDAADLAKDAAKKANDAATKVDEVVSDLGDTAANTAAAKESAEAAAKSASDARASEDSARASAESASSDSNSASSSATAAQQSATDAASSATGASQSATDAKSSADSASLSASSASADAQKASQSASTAASAASFASEAAATAQSAVGTAQAAATSAQEDASTAQTAAETATTQEHAASASASAAAQFASAAAQSATNAKASADLAAGWVPDGGEPGQLLAKTEGGTAWVDPPSGNIPKRTVTDLVAHGEDAYAQRPIEVRVKGKTWVNLWPVINKSLATGATVSTDDTGLMTLSGTMQATSDIFGAFITSVAAGKSYTIAFTSLPTGVAVTVEAWNDSTLVSTIASFSSNTKITGTLTVPVGATRMWVHAIAAVGTDVSGSFRVMLVDGTEAPDCFTPPASITSVETGNLVTAGKNLFDYTKQAGSWFTAGTLSAGTYTMSLDSLGDWWTENAGNDRAIYWYMHDSLAAAAAAAVAAAGGGLPIGHTDFGTANFVGADIGVRSSATLTTDTSGCILFVAYYGPTWIDQVTNIQLELGSTATEYEPPTVTTTPLPEVELRSLPNGTCDELVINADGTCEVERRTKLADGEVVALDTPTVEPQSPVALPVLPAPTFNQYHDADVPSDTSTQYARDINIVLDNLAKQVAGTASAVAVHEASTIEEE